MNRKLLMAFILALFSLSLVLSGCASSERRAERTGGKADPSAVKPIKLTIATSWPSGLMLQKFPEKFAKEVKLASGGRLEVEVHPGGSIVGALEVMDAANAGTIDGYHSVSCYWMGKAPAASLFTSVPMGFEPFMYLTWIYDQGGLELWQKCYDKAGFNVKVIPLGITHPEMMAHSHKELKKLEDFKGLKHRTAAEFAQIFKSIGVSVVTLPGAEVYPSLERKVIDSAEFSTPGVNRALGFNEITKYYTGPGVHQPACLFELCINKNTWDKLPDDLKEIVQIVARSVTLWAWTADFKESMAAIDYYKSKGNIPVRISDDAQKEIRKAAWAFLDQKAKEDPIYNETWTSIKNYYKKFVDYEDFMVPIRAK